ncbi:unnamed protein product [Durusdinium trenchii]|uniref:Uncharacterized protein n=1 Tax=Durusdinium trenchii TaxID=1381693 RepID=A0ABP0LKY3_9DINO
MALELRDASEGKMVSERFQELKSLLVQLGELAWRQGTTAIEEACKVLDIAYKERERRWGDDGKVDRSRSRKSWRFAKRFLAGHSRRRGSPWMSLSAIFLLTCSAPPRPSRSSSR